MRRILLALALAPFLAPASALAGYDVATFADTGLITGVGQYNNSSGGFYSGGQYFNNVYYSSYGGYSTGFAVSSMTDTTTPGSSNQFSAITGTGSSNPVVVNGVTLPTTPDADYAVLYPQAYVNLSGYAYSIDLTNTTYAYLSMKTGDQFAKKFGKGDFFEVVMTGYSGANETGTTTGVTSSYLANYTSDASSPINTWNTVSLLGLGAAQSIGFTFLSSDVGAFGINTPEYVAIDNLVTTPNLVPEPSSWLLIAAGVGIAGLAGRRQLAQSGRV